MTPREQARVISDAVYATLSQLPDSVLEAIIRERITLLDLAKASGNNAAQALQGDGI